MDKSQEAIKSMAHKTVGEMYNHKKKWEGNVVITNTVVKVEDLLKEVDETVTRQGRKTEGFTQTKEEYRENINTDTDIILGIFRSYAKTNGDNVLYQESKMTLSEIKYIKDTEIMSTVNKVLKYAQEHVDEMKDYGLTDKMVEEYGEEANGYINYLSTPQEIIAERATATEHLAKLFEDIDEQLVEHLDNHMMQFKKKEPQFYKDYKNARIIFDDPTSHLAVYGNVVGEISKLALQYVAVTIIRSKMGTDLDELTYSTTKKGNFRFKTLKPGKYTIRFELDGYDTLSIDFTLHKGESKKFDVALRVKE